MTDAITASPAQQKINTLRDALAKQKGAFAGVLPAHMKPEKLIRAAMVAAGKNPLLLQCTTSSVLQSVMAAAQLGLDCSGNLGSAYLVPYGTKCQLIPGYRGLIDLAHRSGKTTTFEAHVVREKDEFAYEYGTNKYLTHRPYMGGDAGEVIAAYAIARLANGEWQFEVMPRHKLDAIRNRSRAKSNGPWVTDTEEMYRKCPIRNLAKYVPLSAEMQTAVALEDAAESGGSVVDVIGEIDGADEPEPATESKADAIARELKKRGAQKVEAEPVEEPPSV